MHTEEIEEQIAIKIIDSVHFSGTLNEIQARKVLRGFEILKAMTNLREKTQITIVVFEGSIKPYIKDIQGKSTQEHALILH